MPAFIDEHCHLIAGSCCSWKPVAGTMADHHLNLFRQGLTPADVPWTEDFDRGALVATLGEAATLGLVSVTEMGFGAFDEWYALSQLREHDGLPLRVKMFALSGLAETTGPPALAAMRTGDPMLDIQGVKFYADGWLGLRTCALRSPFADRPGENGLLFLTAEKLARRAAPFAEAGLQIATHAIGDRAIEAALDGYELMFSNPATCRAASPRIEHAQVLTPDLVARMAEWGVVACIQPSFGVLDFAEAQLALGNDRMQWAYNWQLLLDAGVRGITGSDFPMAPLSPTIGLEHLTTAPLHPLTQEQAVALMTMNF